MNGLALLPLLVAATAAAPESPAPRYAVVVGHNSSLQGSDKTLRFADDDAARFYELFAPIARQSWLLTSFDEDSQAVFPQLVQRARPPTRGQLDVALRELRSRLEADVEAGDAPEVWFYYAGHGEVEDGRGFVHLEGGRFTREALEAELLDGNPARVTHVIIDACNAYFMASGRGPGGRRAPQVEAFAGPGRRGRVGYVLATASDADSHEWSEFSGGVFSHEVRSALIGAGDVDRDGRVDYAELAAFVAVANESIPYPRYRPRVFIQAPRDSRDAAIFEPEALRSAGATALRIDSSHSGRVSLTSERGLRYADMHKGPDLDVQLALLSGRRYELHVDAQEYSVEAAGEPLELAALQPVSGGVASRGELIHEAFSHLFEARFDQNVVRGFRLGQRFGPGRVTDTAQESRRQLWSGALFAGSTLLLGAGAAMTGLAVDARGDADRAAQADRPRLDRRTRGFTGGAAAAYALGLAAGGAALYLLLAD